MTSLPLTKETLYFQSAVGKIYYHPNGFVRLAWSAERISLELIQLFYEQVLSLLLNSNARKVLSEHGGRAPLTGPAQQWITGNWMPRVMSIAQTRHCAIVEGANPLHRLSAQSVVATAPAAFVLRRFSTVEDAQAWLETISA